MPRKKKVKERLLKIPFNMKISSPPIFFATGEDGERFLTMPFVLASALCRYDIENEFADVIKDKQQLTDVLAIVEKHFSQQLFDFRIKCEFDYSMANEFEKLTHEQIQGLHFKSDKKEL